MCSTFVHLEFDLHISPHIQFTASLHVYTPHLHLLRAQGSSPAAALQHRTERGTFLAARAVGTQGKGSVLAPEAVGAQRKGSVLATKAVKAQGKGIVLLVAPKAAEIRSKGGVLAPKAVATQGRGSVLATKAAATHGEGGVLPAQSSCTVPASALCTYYMVQTANTGHHLTVATAGVPNWGRNRRHGTSFSCGGNSSWCPELGSRGHTPSRRGCGHRSHYAPRRRRRPSTPPAGGTARQRHAEQSAVLPPSL